MTLTLATPLQVPTIPLGVMGHDLSITQDSISLWAWRTKTKQVLTKQFTKHMHHLSLDTLPVNEQCIIRKFCYLTTKSTGEYISALSGAIM